MKLALLAAIAVIPFAYAPASAKSAGPVVVEAPLTPLAIWSRSMTKSIDDKLAFPYQASARTLNGLVSVTFHCSDDGTPVGLKVLQRSGETSLDQAAMRAISRVKTMHPLPAGLRSDQKFQANIIFADSRTEYDRQLKVLARETAKRPALLMDTENTFVLGVTPRPQG